MGTFSVEIQVRRMGAGDSTLTPVKCLADTGAAFCQFPSPVLASLGVTPDRHVPVVLADGARREQPATWLEVGYGDRVAFTPVLFGRDDGLTLLGAHALEGLRLAVDPVRRVLEPSRFPLA